MSFNSETKDKLPFNQRKWVKQIKPKYKITRSLSDEGPSKPLKPIECLLKLRFSNQAIIEKHKPTSLIQMVKSSTLPVILQEASGSEESLYDAEERHETACGGFSPVVEEDKYAEDQRAKPRRWTMLSRLGKCDSLPVNFEKDEQENISDTTLKSPEPSVCVKLEDDITMKREQIEDNKGSMATYKHILFVVPLKRLRSSKEINLENISKLTSLSECKKVIEYDEETAGMKAFRKMLKSSSPIHFHRENILHNDDPEKIAALFDTIKESWNLLANILDSDQKEIFISENECKKELSKSSDEKIPALHDYKDMIKENKDLKKEILFLKQQLLEKERKIQKMEFMFGN